MMTDHGIAKASRWLANELGLGTMKSVGKDVYIIILARYLRLFAYGAIALILALYFEELGFSDAQIGLFMTLTLLGDVVVSLLLTLLADSLGRRRTLFLGAASMALSGAVFALTSNYVLLLMAAIIGVISPTGNEIGPFRAIEESTLAHLVPEAQRSDVFTWYVVLAVLGTSSGLVAGGQIIDGLQALEGWTELDAYRAIFWTYTGVGGLKALMTLFLSRECEHSQKEELQEEEREDNENEPLLGGYDGQDACGEAHSESKKSAKRWNPISRISKPTRWILLKLCGLFFLDSLGSGMVPFSLINFYLERKFHLEKGKLGGIMSATWFISTIGNVFAASLAKRIGLIQAMVATHLPSSVFLALLPAPPGLPITICLLIARATLNSMDQAPRSAFLSIVVLPEERTAVMGVVNILKTLSQSGGPWVTGLLAGHSHFWVAFVTAGSLKGTYDLLLLVFFAGRVVPREAAILPGQDDGNHHVEDERPDAETHRNIEEGESEVEGPKIPSQSLGQRGHTGVAKPLSASSTLRPRILYLDAYDSFSNNIIAQVEHCVDADVVKCVIDCDSISSFSDYLKGFDAVIAGPGPGWAACDKDVGLMKALWDLSDEDLLPILGICLGFQSMCLAFGADIERLGEPRHGLVSEILHNGQSIFSGVEKLEATQYHSLQVMVRHRIQVTKAVRYPAELWEPTETCPDLEPLAWDFDSKRNGAVLMAAKHVKKPLWGVQFHPESICTNHEGTRIIRNWWDAARSWRQEREMATSEDSTQPETVANPIPNLSTSFAICTPEDVATFVGHDDEESHPNLPSTSVHCATTGSGRLTVSDIVELFNVPHGEAIVLESGLQPDLLPIATGTGRHSIIGLIIPGETPRIHYYAGTQLMQLRDGKDKITREWRCPEPWQWIRSFMGHLRQMIRHPPTTPTWAPFWGGLMGFASYEAGLETIQVLPGENGTYPDLCFAYITRSVVMDHQLKKIYIQSIRGAEDGLWVRDAWEKLYEAVGRKSAESTPNRTPMPRSNPFEQDSTLNTYLSSCTEIFAEREEYCAAVSSCKSQIADGQSYELCLTTTNQIQNNELSWKLYKRLTSQNPAPFSAYMRIHNVHILSSSPERYISWDRTQTAQCRPIKGTVAKQNGVTAADAHTILSSPKERAENLMIVDLVRHQLHGVYGSGNVHVRKLMEIEEYKTLWQLVSVVEGAPRSVKKAETPGEWEDPTDFMSVPESVSKDEGGYFGYDAFVQSLPPGSMTGAPKKRSCEILQHEEGRQRRGIYSGVLGYLDVGGGGDFSVVIRTAIKTDDAATSTTEDVWTIGAGGAITAQSSPQSEYEEMLAKFQSTARAFKPQVSTSRLSDEEQRKLGELAAVSAAMHDGVDVDVGEGAAEMARTLLGTLENFRAQLEMLEREAVVLNRGPG
ncbi:para-aminobenzoate synthase [Lentithecium fluviatile CBS 122367]|uniref:aminodeoxychorismate synthase n=1 Tax=Lentithecium fluviatile CBS 122367 TaxID=1168545 RepID=A0A6G1JDU6_9PLEO|nr:para-aminobenzoate synthase [Lentithecium fluviatile CBS 122367]